MPFSERRDSIAFGDGKRSSEVIGGQTPKTLLSQYLKIRSVDWEGKNPAFLMEVSNCFRMPILFASCVLYLFYSFKSIYTAFAFAMFQQVDREYGIQSALSKARFPVPKMVHLCRDASIIGQEFYIMEHVEVVLV